MIVVVRHCVITWCLLRSLVCDEFGVDSDVDEIMMVIMIGVNMMMMVMLVMMVNIVVLLVVMFVRC